MSTPFPGQIRCPTCHRSTPPAAFCTQCGSAIPASARARPRGLDREELQERIRIHRPGDAPFRRGSPAGEGPEAPLSPYQPFRPEPEDELVLPASDAAAPDAPRVDHTPPGFDDRPAPPPPPVTPLPSVFSRPAPDRAPPPKPATPPRPRAVPSPVPVPLAAVEPPPPETEEPYSAAEPYDYSYRVPSDNWNRGGSGMSPMAIGGFVLLGILAIAVGAFMSGIFTGGVAIQSPSPTPSVSVAPSATALPSLEPTPSPSVAATPIASSNGSPAVFPDGFTARTEPCAEEPSGPDGCNSSGATISGGSVWVWVGFRKGNSADVLGVSVVNASGSSVGDGSLDLGSIGCNDSCSGWGRFRFTGLSVGNYTIRVSRNGTLAAEATFTVTG